MNMRYPVILLMLFSLQACKSLTEDNTAVYSELNETLAKVKQRLTYSNAFIVDALNKKLSDEQTANKASNWYPKAMLVQHLTSEKVDLIEGLERAFLQETETNRSDKAAATRFFYEEKKVDSIKAALLEFKKDLLAVDPQISSEFEDQASALTDKENSTYLTVVFKNASQDKAISVLKDLEVKLILLENNVTSFCNNKVPEIDRSTIKL